MKIKTTMDGKEIKVLDGQTILQAAYENNINIPSLCHDERVKVYGSCGICVVEVEGNPRLLRACATLVTKEMKIVTNSPRIMDARRFALELMLSDHQGDCRPPCTLKCPGKTDCQGYVGLIANGRFKEASALVKDTFPLPASIGRICPHPCEDACRREMVEEPISIAALKSVAGDYDLLHGEPYKPPIAKETGKSVAIVGGGPGGLTAAYQLRRRGHKVVVFDAMPEMGGMLRYGIPAYRLPKDILDKEIKLLSDMGIDLINNHKVDRNLKLSYLQSNYDAVVVAIGAWKSTGMSIPGDDSIGVYGGIYFLCDVALGKPVDLGKKVAVVGGGNTAMDACRTALRLGVEDVYIVYRRTRDEMPAEEIEIKEAEEEGVIFKYLTNPLEIIDDDNGKVCGLRLQKMELGEPDKSGRRSPVPIEGAEERLDVDSVILAIGQGTDISGFEDLELTRWKTIVADEKTFVTNLPGVFAIGDATNNGAGIAIEAIGEAVAATEIIHSYMLTKKLPEVNKLYYATEEKTAADFVDKEKQSREQMEHIDPMERRTNFNVITDGLSLEQAKKEASRCLECGCADVFDCKLLKYAHEYNVNPDKYAGAKNDNYLDLSSPYFYRNMNKCILCGLCVRVCEEAIGCTALGFFGRGFNTVAEVAPKAGSTTASPEQKTPIAESDCIYCGQCVGLCPTGAISERLTNIEKPVPLAEEEILTVCSFCSMACGMKLTMAAGMPLRCIPTHTSFLCARGRFGTLEMVKEERVTTPMIRRDGELVPCTYDEAHAYIAERIEELRRKKAVAVTVSDRYTNEEIYVMKDFSKKFGKDKFFSFSISTSGLADVIDTSASTCDFDALKLTEVILLVCHDILTSHPVAAYKIKQAVNNGAKLILVTDTKTPIADWACEVIGLNEDSLKYNEILKRAKSSVIVFEEKAVTRTVARILGNMMAKKGFFKERDRGIIQLMQNVNSQGLYCMNVNPNIDYLIGEIKEKDIRSLFIFGEDVPDIDLSELELLVVLDTYLTETAKKAHVFFPASNYAEVDGTYVDTVCTFKAVKAFMKPLVKTNAETIYDMAEAVGYPLERISAREIGFYARDLIKRYFKNDHNWAEAKIIGEVAFTEAKNTNSLISRVNEKLKR